MTASVRSTSVPLPSSRGAKVPALVPISLLKQAAKSAAFQPSSEGLLKLSAGPLAPRDEGSGAVFEPADMGSSRPFSPRSALRLPPSES